MFKKKKKKRKARPGRQPALPGGWDECLQGRGESTHWKGTDFYVNTVFSFQEPPLKPHILVKRLFLLIWVTDLWAARPSDSLVGEIPDSQYHRAAKNRNHVPEPQNRTETNTTALSVTEKSNRNYNCALSYDLKCTKATANALESSRLCGQVP